MAGYDAQDRREMPVETELSQAQSDSDDLDVVSAVHGLTGLVTDVDHLDVVLSQIAAFVVAAVPAAEGAGITLMRQIYEVPQVAAWAVTDPFVREMDHLQYEVLREGPCLTAMATGRTVVSGSLGAEGRYPRFGPRAARQGVHSALALPLSVAGVTAGAINIYARRRDAFADHDVAMAQRFAGPAAIAVHNVQRLNDASTVARQLQAALVSRATIDQAIGILRARSGGSAEEGFERLKRISQAENAKLSVVAERIVEEAVRRAHARHSDQ